MKMDEEEESIWSPFVTLYETFFFMSKFSMEAFSQMKYELKVKRKKGHNFSYNVPKRPKVEKKIYF